MRILASAFRLRLLHSQWKTIRMIQQTSLTCSGIEWRYTSPWRKTVRRVALSVTRRRQNMLTLPRDGVKPGSCGAVPVHPVPRPSVNAPQVLAAVVRTRYHCHVVLIRALRSVARIDGCRYCSRDYKKQQTNIQ